MSQNHQKTNEAMVVSTATESLQENLKKKLQLLKERQDLLRKKKRKKQLRRPWVHEAMLVCATFLLVDGFMGARQTAYLLSESRGSVFGLGIAFLLVNITISGLYFALVKDSFSDHLALTGASNVAKKDIIVPALASLGVIATSLFSGAFPFELGLICCFLLIWTLAMTVANLSNLWSVYELKETFRRVEEAEAARKELESAHSQNLLN